MRKSLAMVIDVGCWASRLGWRDRDCQAPCCATPRGMVGQREIDHCTCVGRVNPVCPQHNPCAHATWLKEQAGSGH